MSPTIRHKYKYFHSTVQRAKDRWQKFILPFAVWRKTTEVKLNLSNGSYKLIEFLAGRRSGADTVINVATIEFRFRAIELIEKFVLDVAYEKIGVAGSQFCTHGHTIDLFVITVSEWKTV